MPCADFLDPTTFASGPADEDEEEWDRRARSGDMRPTPLDAAAAQGLDPARAVQLLHALARGDLPGMQEVGVPPGPLGEGRCCVREAAHVLVWCYSMTGQLSQDSSVLQAAGGKETGLQRLLFSLVRARLVVQMEAPPKVRMHACCCRRAHHVAVGKP